MTVLVVEQLARHFGAIRAVDGVDLRLAEGEVLGLMGDNGAGKSTLLKMVAGNLRPDSGRILVDGASVRFRRPLDARECGIEVVHQDLALCDNLSAAANIYLGRELSRRRFGFLPLLDHRAMEARARELFEELQSQTRAEDLVRSMSGGQRQAVAIARTRLSQPRVVLLDEPTAAISVRQVEQVLDLIRRLRDQGVGVVLVSHRMDDVFAVCDSIVILRRGHKVAELERSATTPEEVTAYITGASSLAAASHSASSPAEVTGPGSDD